MHAASRPLIQVRWPLPQACRIQAPHPDPSSRPHGAPRPLDRRTHHDEVEMQLVLAELVVVNELHSCRQLQSNSIGSVHRALGLFVMGWGGCSLVQVLMQSHVTSHVTQLGG